MKQLILSVIFLSTFAFANGQTADSVAPKHLDEVTVEASGALATPRKNVFIPTDRQRNAASTGLELLSRMNISCVEVNPMSGAVKSLSGQNVDFFINWQPANANDVAGINPGNVKRVEYYDFPTDPRFMRAAHVVNFITITSIVGGYTKIAGRERFGISATEASVYSKLNVMRMEYDLAASVVLDNSAHSGTDGRDIFRFDTGEVVRGVAIESNNAKNRDYFTAARATYTAESGLRITNTISTTGKIIPRAEEAGIVNLSWPTEKDAYSYLSVTRYTTVQPSYQGEIYAPLRHAITLNATLSAGLNHTNSDSEYSTPQTYLINSARENTVSTRANIQVNKKFTERFSTFVNVISGWNHSKIRYSGNSSAINTFSLGYCGPSLGTAFNAEKWSASADFGAALESNTINSSNVTEAYPFTHISASYAPNAKMSLSLWAQYAAMSADAAMKNPNTIQQNEVLSIAGNPYLRCSKHITASLSFAFFPNSRWQMSAYGVLFRIAGRQVPIYLPDASGTAMLKKYFNDGVYGHGQVGARLSARFFDGSLSASVSPRLLLYHVTGTNSISRYPFMVSGNVDYYLGNFSFSLYGAAPGRYVDGETCYYCRMPGEYSLSSTWARNGWHVSVALINIFNKSWIESREHLSTPRFDGQAFRYGPGYHRRISLSVTYTLNYGRKVDPANELQTESASSSAILR